MKKPIQPMHVPGMKRGEEAVLEEGREPGRNINRRDYRSSRDSTGISPQHHRPILPAMPNIPPP
jgi:hypothetical protein